MATDHPEWNDILAFVEAQRARGESHGAQSGAPRWSAEDLRVHLESCSQCARLAHQAEALLERLARARSHRPSPEQVAAATEFVMAVFDQERSWPLAGLLRSGWPASALEALQGAWARLVEDSWTMSPALRASTVAAQPRMLLYETEAFTITVSLTPGPRDGTVGVRGQVTPRGASRRDAQQTAPSGEQGRAMLRCGEQERVASLEAFGAFSFASLPSPPKDEPIRLAIALADTLIRLTLPASSDAS